VQRAEYADLKVYLPNDVLVKVEIDEHAAQPRGPAARCSIGRIVELAFRIPAARKQSLRQSKRLLRQLARKRLAAGAVRGGPKRGFTAPIGASGSAAAMPPISSATCSGRSQR